MPVLVVLSSYAEETWSLEALDKIEKVQWLYAIRYEISQVRHPAIPPKSLCDLVTVTTQH